MLLRRRRKNGKTNLYSSVVENKCLDCGRVVQRHVLYLGDARVPRKVASRFPDHDLANARDFGAINFVESRTRRRRRCSAKRSRCSIQTPEAPGRWPCSRGSWRGRVGGRRLGGAAAAVRNAPASSATVGRLLVGRAAVARAATRPLLGRAPAREPEANALGRESSSAGRLPADRTRQRVAAASQGSEITPIASAHCVVWMCYWQGRCPCQRAIVGRRSRARPPKRAGAGSSKSPSCAPRARS